MSQEIEITLINQAKKLGVKNQDDLERLMNKANEGNDREKFLAYVDLQNKIEQYSDRYNKDIFSQISGRQPKTVQNSTNTQTGAAASTKPKAKRTKKKKNVQSNPSLAHQGQGVPPSNLSYLSSPVLYPPPNQPQYQYVYDPSNPSQPPQFIQYIQHPPPLTAQFPNQQQQQQRFLKSLPLQ